MKWRAVSGRSADAIDRDRERAATRTPPLLPTPRTHPPARSGRWLCWAPEQARARQQQCSLSSPAPRRALLLPAPDCTPMHFSPLTPSNDVGVKTSRTHQSGIILLHPAVRVCVHLTLRNKLISSAPILQTNIFNLLNIHFILNAHFLDLNLHKLLQYIKTSRLCT